MVCVIDRYVPEQSLEFHTEDERGDTRTRWWYRMEPSPEGTAVTEGFLRVATLSRARAWAERKVLGDRAEYNGHNIDESLRRLAELIEA